jgi:hypothetical protein
MILRPHRYLAIAICVLALLAGVAQASPRDYLFKEQQICDAQGVFCMRGSLYYLSNSRLMHLRGRVQKAPGSGLLKIRLAGTNELGHQRYAPFEVRVRGNSSEIINHKMIPDHPDVQNWSVQQITYVPD